MQSLWMEFSQDGMFKGSLPMIVNSNLALSPSVVSWQKVLSEVLIWDLLLSMEDSLVAFAQSFSSVICLGSGSEEL